MKKVVVSAVMVIALVVSSCKTEKKEVQDTVEKTTNVAMTTESFGVRGNCGMCKKTIEKAANGVEGVAKATWDKQRKSMEVYFDGSKTDAMAVQKAIAEAGYDTEKVAGNLNAYDQLPGCCQYDHEMTMNRSADEQDPSTH